MMRITQKTVPIEVHLAHALLPIYADQMCGEA
jgi:hypothetical protein